MEEHDRHQNDSLGEISQKDKRTKMSITMQKASFTNHQEQYQKIKNLIRPREQRFHIMKTTKNKTIWGIRFANHIEQYQEDHSDNHKHHVKQDLEVHNVNLQKP